MQLKDALTIPKIFIGLDIHKKSWSVSPSVTEDLFQYVEQTFPKHEVALVYEAGCCGFYAALFFKLKFACFGSQSFRCQHVKR